MGLTPWRVAWLLVGAALLATIAVLDATQPKAKAPELSCTHALASQHEGLLDQAEREYRAILAKEPSTKCALARLPSIAEAWCGRGAELKEKKLSAQAVEAYSKALALQPYRTKALDCASEGLGGAGSVRECRGALKAACIDLIVNVNGVNGRNGRNGKNGRNGINGANGSAGRNGRNGRNGSNGWPGPTGRSGANGRNGMNGRNGHNGHNGHNGRNGLNGADGGYGPCGATGCS